VLREKSNVKKVWKPKRGETKAKRIPAVYDGKNSEGDNPMSV